MDVIAKSMSDVIRTSNEPTRVALAMAHAIRQHLADVADDDPSDDDEWVMPLVACALRSIDALVDALTRMTER
jgi:hypothetical protein